MHPSLPNLKVLFMRLTCPIQAILVPFFPGHYVCTIVGKQQFHVNDFDLSIIKTKLIN